MNWNDVLTIASALVCISGAVAAVKGWIMPTVTYRRKVDELEKKSLRDWEALGMLLSAVVILLNHELDGNHKEDVRKTRDEIVDFLAKRK